MIDRENIGEVAVVRLAHGKANVLDLELCQELASTFRALEDETAAAVVLTGAGRSFSAGVDLLRILEGGAGYVGRFLPALEDAIHSVSAFPRPVVAAVNGHAIAGGCLIACAADRRWMVERGAGIGVPELQVGVPFPAIALEILRSAVSTVDARRLVLSGALLDPSTAVSVGLIDELAAAEELEERALADARRLASIPALSFKLTKRQLRGSARGLPAAVGSIDEDVKEIWSQPEILEAIRAYVERTFKKSAS